VESRHRVLAALSGEKPDHVPLICRVFGFAAPPALRWEHAERPVPHWYTMRLEHIHTLPEPWDLEQDFRRIEAWLRFGIDDVIEVSPPWGIDPAVRIDEWVEDSAGARIACRRYTMPSGILDHKVRCDAAPPAPGWVIQPDFPPLFEDFNVPRAVRPAVAGASDLAALRHLLRPPAPPALEAFRARMRAIRRFADTRGVLVCGWSLFGMDAAVWLCGAEAAVLMAMTEPDTFSELVSIIESFDRMRTEILLDAGGVDLVIQRGWYGSTDFWSPDLFDRFAAPALARSVSLVHEAGARFGYVMTTGVAPLLRHLVRAGVDLFLWADPVQGGADLATVRRELGDRVAIAGGVNAPLTLGKASPSDIRRAVRDAISTLGPTRFILEPVDSLFPDTPWPAVETMIEAWKETWR